MTTPALREAARAVMDIYDSKYPYGYNVTMIWADLRAAIAQPGEELWHQCPDCKNHFLQPFVCTTCGAQKLYDTTVFSQQQVLDAQAARIERLERALEAWDKAFCHEECMTGIFAALSDEYPEFLDECRYAMSMTKEARK